MFIVMHCMGMPFNGSTIDNESLGGSETAAYYIAKELAREGHSVTLFTMHKEGGVWDKVMYVPIGECTKQAPLGADFHLYAQGNPHDVLIIQRSPIAFKFKWASKVNLWWTHDMPTIEARDHVNNQMWNIDGILTVSQYHKEQLCTQYGIHERVIFPITNGVDLSLFTDRPTRKNAKPFQLLYSSRPERGLENLVKDGGIMDQLGDDYQLSVCAYENTAAAMEPYYKYLYEQVEKKSNVHNLGALTKKQLAGQMLMNDVLVYPTTFPEVSCITAMEAMAAGLPMVSSNFAALPETCGTGALLLPLKDGKVNEALFVTNVKKVCERYIFWRKASKRQILKGKNYSWQKAAKRIEAVIEGLFNNSPLATYNAMIHNSDIIASDKLLEAAMDKGDDKLLAFKAKQKIELYKFAQEGTFKQYYEDYYEYEEQRGVKCGPEDPSGDLRFNCVADTLADLPAGSVVLDYGCAHGHYTINLAKRYPDLRFVGIDLASSNIEKAERWATDDGVENVRFYTGAIDIGDAVVDKDGLVYLQKLGGNKNQRPALILAGEVIEHIGDIKKLVDALLKIAAPQAKIVITTPYGPWEAYGFADQYPWRAHLHHLERADLHDMWKHFPDFAIMALPATVDWQDNIVGNYLTTFTNDRELSTRAIDYDRKIKLATAKQTVSLCMIVKDAETSIARTIETVTGVVSEIIIGVDNTTTDKTSEVLGKLAVKHPLIRFELMLIGSPLDTGFAMARNAVIEKASGDWIMWIDADELFVGINNLDKYLRNSQYNGLSIQQHHFSCDPPALMQTDLPVRVFRNHCGIKFMGVVHEHPEMVLNEGVGHAMVVPDVSIAHYGYLDNNSRKAKFYRNFELMKRDRKENPDRVLGKSLWVRDLAQSIKFELEAGVPENETMLQRAQQGIELWRELLEDNTRMANDSLEFYSSLVMFLHPDSCINYGFSIKAQKANGHALSMDEATSYKGTFFNVDHAQTFFGKIEADNLREMELL